MRLVDLDKILKDRVSVNHPESIERKDWESWMAAPQTKAFLELLIQTKVQLLQDIPKITGEDLTIQYHRLVGAFEQISSIIDYANELGGDEDA